MNRLLEKRDLSIATQSHAYQLQTYHAELQEREGELLITYKRFKQNVYTLSATGEWTAQEISRFLGAARQAFDVILLDRGYIQSSDPDLAPLLRETDAFVYVARPDAFSLTHARNLLGRLPQANTKLLLSHYDASVVVYPLLGTVSYTPNLLPVDVVALSHDRGLPTLLSFAVLSGVAFLLTLGLPLVFLQNLLLAAVLSGCNVARLRTAKRHLTACSLTCTTPRTPTKSGRRLRKRS